MDGFDQLPDPLIMLIFNSISDIKSLIRCRSVSKRFNSLVPQTEHLFLRVDRVISHESDSDSDLFTILRSFLKSLQNLLSTSTKLQDSNGIPAPSSPAQILRQFDRVRSLRIELPSGDLKLEKGVTVKWKAEFGGSLKSCVIVGFKSEPRGTVSENLGEGGDVDMAVGGLKTRVMWTINALISATARHFMLEEVLRARGEMESLVLTDREGEGTVVMNKEGIKECRLETAHVSEGRFPERSRTMVPNVRMRMRHAPRLLLVDGVFVESATLVVVRPTEGNDDVDDAEVALGAFGDGFYREMVQELLKTRSYVLEMNSF